MIVFKKNLSSAPHFSSWICPGLERVYKKLEAGEKSHHILVWCVMGRGNKLKTQKIKASSPKLAAINPPVN